MNRHITSKRIRTRRELLGLSQDELAQIMGYTSRSTIAKIESGANNVKMNQVENFAVALHTSPAYLMGWVDNPELTHEETLKLEKMRMSQIAKHDNTDIITPYLDTSPVSPDQIRTIAANTGDADSSSSASDSPEISEEQKKRNRLAYKILNSDYSADEIDKIETMIDLWTNK